ncbi:MAG: 30S ribosomal protein S16 [Chlamydiota bacterium]
MALMIRLRQQGNRNRHTYRLVLMEKRAPRDGAYKALLGWYNPALKEDTHLHKEQIAHWLNLGAQISEKAKALVKRAAPEILQAVEEKKREQKKKKRAKAIASKEGT